MTNIVKCQGSGRLQMVDWMPDDKPTEEFPRGYPGASVCSYCNYGVLLIKGSVHDAVSGTGVEGKGGKLRVHYVSRDGEHMSYHKPARMRVQ